MSALVVIAALAAGALGALARYGVTRAVARRFPQRLTRAVLIVNILGSFIAGTLAGVGYGAWADARYILVGGFAGGLTTFSTWSVETIQLVLAGRTRDAVTNVAANVVWGLLAGVLGLGLSVLAVSAIVLTGIVAG